MREFAKVLTGGRASALYGGAGAAAAKETVTGELVSVWCYIQSRQNVGSAGYVCALSDLKWEGNPPGVLTPNGTVYQLAGSVLGENNSRVVPHIGKTVTVTGEVTQSNGIRLMTADELRVVSK